MENSQEFKKTEKYAVEEEIRENEWQKQYGEKLPDVVERMDALLLTGTEDSRWKLIQMFLDRKFFEKYKQTDTIASMRVVAEIYESEIKMEYQHTILDHAKTVKELCLYLQDIKFIFYRLDFDIDKEAEYELLELLKERQPSAIFIKYMMVTVAMRPLNLAMKLMQLFDANCKFQYLFSILNFIEEKWPGNYCVLQKLAQLCESTGRREYAREYSSRIPEYPPECGGKQEVLQLQEMLWMLRHGNKEMGRELTDKIKERNLSDKAWSIYLKNEGQEKMEFYLYLAEILLEAQMNDKAWITLETADKWVPGNEMVLCFMADLKLEQGRIGQALECLDRVENPGEFTRRLTDTCKHVLKRGTV